MLLSDLRPIGIFDSGIGGLGMVKLISKHFPHENIIYFADTKNFPWGSKKHIDINYHCNIILKKLKKFNCKIIIIACNTASIALNNLNKYNNDNDISLLNVINMTINYIKLNDYKNIGIIGTNFTVKSNMHKDKINKLQKNIKCYSLATPLLAPLITIDNKLEGSKTLKKILYKYLSCNLFLNIDSLILGCTHYWFIKSIILDYFINVKKIKEFRLIDPTSLIINDLKNFSFNDRYIYNENNKKGIYIFYVSNHKDYFKEKIISMLSNNFKYRLYSIK